MSKPKNNYRIIFIYKDKLFFCNPEKNESLEFPLANDVVKDLEIIDQLKLEKSLEEFIGEFQKDTAEAMVILNENTYFKTTIEDGDLNPENNKKKIDEFSDLVPFNDIFVKQFTLQKKIEVIAINRAFYEPILNVLRKLNFEIITILPEVVVKNFIGEASCTPEDNSALFKVIHKLEPYDLLGEKHKLLGKDDADIAPIKEQNKRLIILVVVFSFLILVLIGALIFNANRSYDDEIVDTPSIETTTTNVIDGNLEATTSSETISLEEQSVEPEVSSSSADLELDKYKIRILNGSGISGQAGIVATDLEEVGFTSIDIGNTRKISSNKTQVLLTSTLPINIKTLVLNVVENIGQEYTIQESSELNYDIVITTTAAE